MAAPGLKAGEDSVRAKAASAPSVNGAPAPKLSNRATTNDVERDRILAKVLHSLTPPANQTQESWSVGGGSPPSLGFSCSLSIRRAPWLLLKPASKAWG